MDKKTSVILLGPTASGKTSLAVNLAHELNGEIVSADSRQVYQQLDIGTGKDLDEYNINNTKIPHHLIDIHPPGYKYNVKEFQEDAFIAIEDVHQRNKLPIICGGTGFYIESLLKGFPYANIPAIDSLRNELQKLNKEELITLYTPHKPYFNDVDFDSKKRIIRAFEIAQYLKSSNTLPKPKTITPTIIGIDIDRETRRKRITERLEKRFKNGMTNEVETLLANGTKPEDLIYYGLEYKLITEHLIQKTSFNELFQKLEIAIHQYAKRQMTFFRKLEKDGHKIHWIDGGVPKKKQLEATLDIFKLS